MNVRTLDRWTLAGIALGIAAMLQPWWDGGFQAGFFLTIAATLAQIAVSHAPSREP